MQDISLTLIRYFVTLVECGQFVKAAQKISISQPALSKSIKSLEEQLGVPLIKHAKRNFSLTDDGKYFFEASRYLLKLYDDYLFDVSERVSSPYSGIVRIGIPSSILDAFGPDLIMKLHQQYPDIRISTRAESSVQTVASLEEGKTDLCFARSVASNVSIQRLVVKPVLNSAYHLVFPADHPFAQKEEVPMAALQDVRVMLPGESSIVRKELLELTRQVGIKLNVVFSSGSLPTLHTLVRSGFGLAVVPGILVDESDDSITHRPLVPNIPWDMTLVYPDNKFMSLPTKCVCDFIYDYFQGK